MRRTDHYAFRDYCSAADLCVILVDSHVPGHFSDVCVFACRLKKVLKKSLIRKKLQFTSNLQRYRMTGDSAANCLAFRGFGAPITRLLAGQLRFKGVRLHVTEMTSYCDFGAR